MEQKEYIVTAQGSLSLLALGHIGIQKWREAIRTQNNVQKSKDKKFKDKGDEKK
jgi:hypothetical protein